MGKVRGASFHLEAPLLIQIVLHIEQVLYMICSTEGKKHILKMLGCRHSQNSPFISPESSHDSFDNN